MKRVPIHLRRRIQRRSSAPRTMSWVDYLNTFLTSFISIGMLAMAYAQWSATKKQADVADTLAQLEIAKSQAQFEFSASKSLIDLGPQISPASFPLPKSISIEAATGIKSLDELDAQAYVRIYGKDHGYICDLEVRGIYIENDPGILTQFDEPLSSLKVFLHALLKEGLTFDGEAQVLVRYHDLFGNEIWKEYRAKDGFELTRDWMSSVESPEVVYSGAWGNDQGLHFDEPPQSCGSAAGEIVEAAKATGGHSE